MILSNDLAKKSYKIFHLILQKNLQVSGTVILHYLIYDLLGIYYKCLEIFFYRILQDLSEKNLDVQYLILLYLI